ncbi:MAG TPA: hypothetical protein PKD83_02765 [Ignavibacteria bacterium]|nr:hypothetical protein [Ignavibacteria bacterium]
MLIKFRKYLSIIILIPVLISQSCGKKEEPQTFVPPQQENTIDKEKEQKEREEFDRLKRLRDGISDSASIAADTSSQAVDSVKIKTDLEAKKKKLVEKEKELNKRLDNPKTAITDYIEFLQRGTSSGGNFELNMKKASDLWVNGNIDRFKSNYKNTSKIIVVEEPKVVSQSGTNAVVEVKIKKVDGKNNKNEELEMTVKYNLTADSKGKWKIKDNTVVKN